MKKNWTKVLLLLALIVLAAFVYSTRGEFLTFEALKKNGDALAGQVHDHYALSVLAFGAVFFSTAFCIPGALILTISGGFLFGAALGAVYASVFLTAGSTLAFLLSRHFIGDSVQKQYAGHLTRFNAEICRHGINYLLVLRIVPLLPAFLVNLLAGLTPISTARFAAATFVGVCPGAFVYSLAGRQLSLIQTPGDILSGKMLAALLALAVFALVPVIYDQIRGPRRTCPPLKFRQESRSPEKTKGPGKARGLFRPRKKD